ncbi:MAG: GCN5-related N-acetyltransferase [Acidimicrobiaceae bacterium]|jgi:ribosomal protein S18 acetylase RimI-like enzyme|nr:GCN5-related N-acetyltransferase [Acidimicrobiaceae bacterium]
MQPEPRATSEANPTRTVLAPTHGRRATWLGSSVARCAVDNSTVNLIWSSTVDARLREQLASIWVAATNAGGALGFLPPVTSQDIAELADKTFDRVADGLDDLLVAFLAEEPIGWLVLERDARSYAGHWRTLKRLQVHPAHQGNGYATALMEEARRFARDELGLEFLVLTVRDGTGVAGMYERLGYREVGRVPSVMRVAENDDRDEIYMVQSLADSSDVARSRRR